MQMDNSLKADAVFEGGGVKGIGLVDAVASPSLITVNSGNLLVTILANNRDVTLMYSAGKSPVFHRASR